MLLFKNSFIKIRKSNARSLRAITKLNYVQYANTLYPDVYDNINKEEEVYDLFVITKEHYSSYVQFAQVGEREEAEVVS